MNNLLKTNIKLMLCRKSTKLSAVFAVFMALLVAFTNNSSDELTWYTMFSGPVTLIMVLSAVGGLFLSRDYSNKTIRNKLTVGHKRTYIYLANQITEILFFCIPIILYFVTSSVLNYILIGTNGTVMSDIFRNIAVCIIAVIALSALTTFIAMTVKSSAGGILPIVLMYPLLMFSVIIDEFPEIKWLQTVGDMIPLSQIAMLLMPDKNAALHILYSLIVTALFIIVGIASFRKADLK